MATVFTSSLEAVNHLAIFSSQAPSQGKFLANSSGVALTLDIPFQSPSWNQTVTDKVMWMSSKGLKEATIQLEPPELGHLTIKVVVAQEQAKVSFIVQHASVREALDSHALRLRDMFAEEGIQLDDVDVSDQSESQQQNADESEQFVDTKHHSQSDSLESDAVNTIVSTHYNLIDSYV
jgi:flagellar hook-length control protein FliK